MKEITKIDGLVYPPDECEAALPLERREECRQAARLIYSAFVWADTAEGWDFWASLYERLNAISDGEPLR